MTRNTRENSIDKTISIQDDEKRYSSNVISLKIETLKTDNDLNEYNKHYYGPVKRILEEHLELNNRITIKINEDTFGRMKMVKEIKLLKDSLNELNWEIQRQYEEMLQRKLMGDSGLQDMSNVNCSVIMYSADLHKIIDELAALKVSKY